MSSMGGRVPVILCCAEEDEAALAQVVEALRNEGFEPEALPGVELDAGVLGNAVDHNLGAGVYVLCQSENLDAFQMRKLVGLFSARKGPAHKLVTVELDPDYPLDVVTEIMTHAYAFAGVGMKDTASSEGPGASNLRDVVGQSYSGAHESAAPSPAQPRRKRPTTSGRGAGQGRPAHAVRKPATPSRPEPVPEPSAPPASEPAASEAKASEPATPEPETTKPEPDDDTAEIPRRERPQRVEVPVLSASTPGASMSQAAPVVSGPASDKGGSSLQWILGGAVVILLGVIGVIFARPDLMGRGVEPEARQTPPPVETPAAVEKAASEPGVAEPEPEPEPEPESKETPPPAEAKAPAPEPPPPPDPARPGPDEDTLISAAIAKGKLRAIDLLIVIPPRRNAETMEWSAAATHCKRVTIDGVGRFRLATAQQLKQVRRARLLKPGTYWSATLSGAEGVEVLALDTDLRRLITMGKEEEAAPVCVRQRR